MLLLLAFTFLAACPALRNDVSHVTEVGNMPVPQQRSRTRSQWSSSSSSSKSKHGSGGVRIATGDDSAPSPPVWKSQEQIDKNQFWWGDPWQHRSPNFFGFVHCVISVKVYRGGSLRFVFSRLFGSFKHQVVCISVLLYCISSFVFSQTLAN